MTRLNRPISITFLAFAGVLATGGCGAELDLAEEGSAPLGKGDNPLARAAAPAEAVALPAPKLRNPHKGYPYQHKGQPHAHSDESDGHNPPDVVEQAYHDKGYAFVHLTDHNRLTPDPQVPGVLHVPSGEDGYKWRHHMLALGIDLDKVHWYHDNVDPDRDADQDGMDDRDTRSCDNIQGRIDYITQVQGAVAVLAHPTASHDWLGGEGFLLSELKYRKNYTGIEIYNAGGHWATSWWDAVLSTGKRVWGFGSDDCHDVQGNPKSFNRAWIVVNSQQPPVGSSRGAAAMQGALRQDLLQNIKDGNFYTVVRSPQYPASSPSDGTSDRGPLIEITVVSDVVHVKADRPSKEIRFIGSNGILLQRRTNLAQDNYRVNTATEKYVRVEVEQVRDDGERYIAYSQPLSVIQPPPPPECRNGEHRIIGCRMGCCDYGIREDLCVNGRWRKGPCRADGPLP